MKVKLFFILASLPAILTACPFGEFIRIETKIIAHQTTIRVGETIKLAVEREIGRTDKTEHIYGFIYSNNNSWDVVPYLTNMEGDILPKGQPELYPVAPIVEIIEPQNSVNNVSPLASTRYDGRYAQTEFTVRGARVGTAVIRAGFVYHPNEDDYFRLEISPTEEGSVKITVTE